MNKGIEKGLIAVEDLLIVELDDRHEFTVAVVAAVLVDDTNTKCNDSKCNLDVACPKTLL